LKSSAATTAGAASSSLLKNWHENAIRQLDSVGSQFSTTEVRGLLQTAFCR
jgi:hypothetical protein